MSESLEIGSLRHPPRCPPHHLPDVPPTMAAVSAVMSQDTMQQCPSKPTLAKQTLATPDHLNKAGLGKQAST